MTDDLNASDESVETQDSQTTDSEGLDESTGENQSDVQTSSDDGEQGAEDQSAAPQEQDDDSAERSDRIAREQQGRADRLQAEVTRLTNIENQRQDAVDTRSREADDKILNDPDRMAALEAEHGYTAALKMFNEAHFRQLHREDKAGVAQEQAAAKHQENIVKTDDFLKDMEGKYVELGGSKAEFRDYFNGLGGVDAMVQQGVKFGHFEALMENHCYKTHGMRAKTAEQEAGIRNTEKNIRQKMANQQPRGGSATELATVTAGADGLNKIISAGKTMSNEL